MGGLVLRWCLGRPVNRQSTRRKVADVVGMREPLKGPSSAQEKKKHQTRRAHWLRRHLVARPSSAVKRTSGRASAGICRPLQAFAVICLAMAPRDWPTAATGTNLGPPNRKVPAHPTPNTGQSPVVEPGVTEYEYGIESYRQLQLSEGQEHSFPDGFFSCPCLAVAALWRRVPFVDVSNMPDWASGLPVSVFVCPIGPNSPDPSVPSFDLARGCRRGWME